MQFWSSIVVFYTLHVVTVYAAKCDNGTVDATVLMLIGSTGVGKSTTANRIYELKSTWSMEKKSHVFAEGDTAKACTNETQMEVFKTAQGCLRLIDTPGVQATDMPEGVIMTDIAHTMLSLQYGVNAFIFVMRGTNNKLDIGLQKGLDRYTKALGKEFWKNAIVFFNQKEDSIAWHTAANARSEIVKSMEVQYNVSLAGRMIDGNSYPGQPMGWRDDIHRIARTLHV